MGTLEPAGVSKQDHGRSRGSGAEAVAEEQQELEQQEQEQQEQEQQEQPPLWSSRSRRS